MPRKLLFQFLFVVATLASLELIGAVALRLQLGRWAGHSELAAQRLALGADSDRRYGSRAARRARLLRARVTDAQLHPYLGFVESASQGDGADADATSGAALGFPVNQRPLIQKRTPEKLVVGVFGGSVAEIFYDLVGEEFAAQLARTPLAAGREVVVVSAASGGYKQPQQLMALNYLMALGAEFDVVINVDGFNEVALPPHEQVPYGVTPVYPRNWRELVAERDPTLLRATGLLVALRERRLERAQRFSQPPWRWSLLAGAFWTALDQRDQRRLARATAALREGGVVVRSRQILGPPLPQQVAPLELAADVWARSSQQMAQVSAARGVRYLHVLQPNQYVPGSKTLSATERRTAYMEGHAYQAGVVEGYPLLRARGAALQQQGFPFVDASDLFANRRETFYVDECCHFNRAGNLLLAELLVQHLATPSTSSLR